MFGCILKNLRSGDCSDKFCDGHFLQGQEPRPPGARGTLRVSGLRRCSGTPP